MMADENCGKTNYAEAVKNSIVSQMREIGDTAAAPAAIVREILALQQTLHDELRMQQKMPKSAQTAASHQTTTPKAIAPP